MHFSLKLAFLECLTILLYLPLFVAIFKKVDSAMFTIRETGISDGVCAITLLIMGCVPYIVGFTMRALRRVKRLKEYRNGLKRMSQVFMKEVGVVVGIILIGFVPYALRLAVEDETLRVGLIIAAILYTPCLAYTIYLLIS